MKLAWVSPYAITSAIGHYSTIVCDALAARDIDVVKVRCDRLSDPHGEFFPYDIAFDAFLHAGPGAFDHVIYNVGNELNNHGPLVEDGIPPGLFVLHDIAYPHLYFAYCERHGQDILASLGTLAELGIVRSDYAEIYQEMLSAETSDRRLEIMAHLDLVGWVTRNASRLVVHSPKPVAEIRAKTGLQVDHLPLAYWTRADTEKVHKLSPKGSEKLVLSTFGHVVANKRIASLIRAIGSDADIAARWQLRIVGPIIEGDKDSYDQLIAAQPHPVDVCFLGRVDDDEFQRQMRIADFISCLRYPSYESGSATLALAMATNGNVLVSDESSSSSMVQGLATFIHARTEEEDIREALTKMQTGQNYDADKQHRVRVRAREMFDAENYANALIGILKQDTFMARDIHGIKEFFPEGEAFNRAVRRWCRTPVQRAAEFASRIERMHREDKNGNTAVR